MPLARLTGNFFEELMAAELYFCMAKLESFVTKVTSRHFTHMTT